MKTERAKLLSDAIERGAVELPRDVDVSDFLEAPERKKPKPIPRDIADLLDIED